MTHTHIGAGGAGRSGRGDATPLIDAAELRRHRRALRILVVVLTPLAIWTLVGLIALWPGDVSDHVNSEVAGYNVPGVTYPTARIIEIKPISCDGLAGSTPGVTTTTCADVTAELLDGDDRGLSVDVPLTAAVYSSGVHVGEKIVLIRVPPTDGQPAQYQFSDFKRTVPLLVLLAAFTAVVVAVARWRGFASLLGLGFAAFILAKFMFPALVSGTNPIMVGLIGSSAIMFVVLYAAHGFSARTSTALVGTLFGLILIAALGWVAGRWAHLTGVASEDDYVLAASAPDLRLTSVVLCGVIVAGLGVLNDVTITQASAVWELADHGESQRKLFSRAMRIGRDHIASTVYTIAFATAGAALSVLLLIAVYDRPMLQVLQTEQFAGEVIRTLVGSIGLVLAVPLTTAVGTAVVRASGANRRSRPEPAHLDEDEEAPTAVLPRTRDRYRSPGTRRVNSTSDAAEPAETAGAAAGASEPARAASPRPEPAEPELAEAEAVEEESAEAEAAGERPGGKTSGGKTSGEERPGEQRPGERAPAAERAGTKPAPRAAKAEPGADAEPAEPHQPAAARNGDRSPVPAEERRRRFRRRTEDDFGDFGYLRDDPSDTDPGPGRRTGR